MSDQKKLKRLALCADMMRAWRAGLKTHTRRVMNPQPHIDAEGGLAPEWARELYDEQQAGAV